MRVPHLPFFRAFSPQLREALVEAGKVHQFEAEDSMFGTAEGEGNDFYILTQGRVNIFKLTEGGQKRLLRTVKPGETFATLSLFDGQSMRIQAEFLGPGQVFMIPREKFFALLEEHPELARFVIDGLVARVRKYGSSYAGMSVYAVDQRFINYLLDLAEHQGSTTVRLPDTLTKIAEHLATAREVLSRELSKMEQKGWISKKRGIIHLKNQKALQQRLAEG